MNSGIAINLIIDSDLCRKASIRVPTGTVQEPRLESVKYDAYDQELPYEERKVLDPNTWNTFGIRVAKTVASLVESPIVERWWEETHKEVSVAETLGEALARARHQLELQWGSHSLEIPQSNICRTPAFHWFAACLLEESERFRTAYNESLAEYRQVHRLRNQAQPMPDLHESARLARNPLLDLVKQFSSAESAVC